MKKKLALLLAGIMTLSAMPINVHAGPVTLSAGTGTGKPAVTRLSRSVLLAPNRTAFVEEGVRGPNGTVSGEVSNSDRVQHFIEGGNLIVAFEEDYATNGSIDFTLQLDNAEWFFRDAGGPDTGNLGTATFNSNNGTWNQSTGVYTRTTDNANELTYQLTVSAANPSVANVRVNAPGERVNSSPQVTLINNNGDNDTLTDEAVEASATIKPENKAPETKIPETKAPSAESFEKEKVKEDKQSESKTPATTKPAVEAPAKEKVAPTTTKPAGEAETKEAPKASETKVPENKAPKTAAVAVSSMQVDAMDPEDDIMGTDTGTTNETNNITNDGTTNQTDTVTNNGTITNRTNDDNSELGAILSYVTSARDRISLAKSNAKEIDATIDSVRTPIDNAQQSITNAQGAATTDIGNEVENLTNDLAKARTELGLAIDALNAMGGDLVETSGANYDNLNDALIAADRAANDAQTALQDATPAPTPEQGGNNEIRNGDIVSIPLVVRTTGENVEASVRVTQANPIPVETGRRVFAEATQQGLTTTRVANPRTGRDRLEIPAIGISENRIGAIPEAGTFELVAPNGYHFGTLGNDVNIVPEGGLVQTSGSTFTSSTELRNDANVLRVTYSGLDKSTRITGSIAITNLVLLSNNTDSIREGDVYLNIRNVGNPAVVTPQRFLVGTVSDWTVSMETIGEIPQLINGRLRGVEKTDVNDAYHKAATVRIEERVENAWWAQRSTTFTLPEQVRVRKVEFNNVRNIANYNTLQGSFYNDRNRSNSSNVRVNDNVVTISGLQSSNTARASFEMDLWLNIESGFEGDVNLVLGGSAISNDTADQQVRIARAISPVTVKVDVENVRIGYQFVPVGDFSITEKVPGALLANEQVYISITDNMFADMHIASGFDYDVTKGDLRIRNMRTGTNLGLNNNNNNNVNVSFEIDRASSEASEITFSNVQVRLSANVPISNEGTNGQGYDLVAWGPAIAANFEGVRPDSNNNDDDDINRNDFFREPGIRAKFVNVESTINNTLTNVVRVTSGSPVIMVDDQEMVMDTAPYVSPASDSMMVPVRFISMGLGVDADRVLWSPDTSTVTIDAGERILQFQTNSSMMRINGIEVPMLNAAGNPVYSEVRDERAFIPFRALGNALNVHVDWNPTTATATFDPTKPATRGASLSDDIAQYGNYNEENNTDNTNINANNTSNGNENTNTNNGTANYAEGYQNGNSQQNRTLVGGMQLNNALQSTTPNSVMQVQNRGLMNRPGYVQTTPMQMQTANR